MLDCLNKVDVIGLVQVQDISGTNWSLVNGKPRILKFNGAGYLLG